MKILKICLAVALAVLLGSCIKVPDFPKNERGGEYYQTYRWSYRGVLDSMGVHMPKAIYEHYHLLPKEMPFPCYVSEDARYPYMQGIVDGLRTRAQRRGLDERETVEFVQAFYQSIEYCSDPGGFSDYPRTAAETLIEKRCDCEDYACAMSGTLSCMGYKTCLIYIPARHHAAVGIAVGDSAYAHYRGINGQPYVFAECTRPNWRLAECPFPDDSVIIYEIAPVYPQSHYVHLNKPGNCHRLREISVTAKGPRHRLQGPIPQPVQ